MFSRAECYKYFYVRNLRIFVGSQSVGPQQAFPVKTNVSGKRPGAYPQSGAPERLFNGVGSCFTNKDSLGWKDLSGTNSSLLRIFVNYGREKFYNIGPWVECNISFYVRNLRIFVGSQRVFVPGKLFQPGLMFQSKARGLPQSGASETCFTWVGSGINCKHQTMLERLAGTNTLAFDHNL